VPPSVPGEVAVRHDHQQVAGSDVRSGRFATDVTRVHARATVRTVAFSSVRTAQSMRVGMYGDESGRFVAKNIVYREVL